VIRRQLVLPADPQEVWEALTDPSKASRWFGGQIEWDLHDGAPLRFHDDDGSARVGHIDVVRPGRYLRYSWWDRPGDDSGPDRADASEVSYLLEEVPGGTRLTIQERSIPRPESPPADSLGQERPDGWTRWDGVMASVWSTTSPTMRSRVIA
jgi:uncharacterized protein YndB with AHSA1/START domain